MTGLKSIVLAAGLALAGMGTAVAQEPAAPAVSTAATASDQAAPANPLVAQDGAPLMAPVEHIGQPSDGRMGLQAQVTPNGHRAHWMHDAILMPAITGISVLVLVLILWCIFAYRRGRNPTPSRTSHHTVIEIIWTLVPVIILVLIAIPSIGLLQAQYKPAPDNAVTLKAIGNQWYWSYEYPDNGDLQITANMLKEKDQVQPGERYRTDVDGPRLLATDNRVVLPVGVPIRLITTASDVIHSWAVPAFWIKLDAVPGRLNETSFTIEKPGVYFGQCSELCGTRHAFMPIAIEAVPPAEFAAWVRAKGGTMPGDEAAPAAAPPIEPGAAVDATATPAIPTQPATPPAPGASTSDL
ncbi:cytochrome c oxidase subunit II [Hephaestia sp. GCM10023244]|uniref:cytochrome c oxidase subunit II n=1 Tax=unclassified Hephaestia TaxID=2631281 RepID=UPI002076F7EB|nr:cytochrome c oxidase subunit II [Hephaestia sp. MAHUQ-44]MCM8730492.1 cytochrome c oxidase subunit II [Hephaestia sp. MAHUQ-44]